MQIRRAKTKKNADPTKGLLTQDSPFAVQEAYKTLRTNVLFSLPGSESRCIGFTSAEAGAGKSQTALNLAISLSQLKKKVILVDCDMRRPTIASKLNINGQPGLSDVLAGEGKAGDAIRKLSELGIDVLPAGNIPPDPAELLSSEQMESLIQVLRRYYDYILLDMPPVMAVTDAAVMSRFLDGYLLVVRHESSEYRLVASMLEQLRRTETKILGFVYNDVEATGKKYYKHYE